MSWATGFGLRPLSMRLEGCLAEGGSCTKSPAKRPTLMPSAELSHSSRFAKKMATARRSRPENWASPESLGARRTARSNIGRSVLFLQERHLSTTAGCSARSPRAVTRDKIPVGLDALPGDSVVSVGNCNGGCSLTNSHETMLDTHPGKRK